MSSHHPTCRRKLLLTLAIGKARRPQPPAISVVRLSLFTALMSACQHRPTCRSASVPRKRAQQAWLTPSHILFQAIVAVRFCPVLFALATPHEEVPAHPQPAAAVQLDREPAVASPIRLPYNMVFAIATMDSVIIYKTQVGCQCPSASFC